MEILYRTVALEVIKQSLAGWRAAFPDIQGTVEDQAVVTDAEPHRAPAYSAT